VFLTQFVILFALQLTEFMEEVQMMAKLYHPRIALFLGACVNGKEISVVSEMLDGDIEHVILRDSSISLLQRMLWARQAALGMAWVHGAGIIHRDLKPSNLLYSKSENAVKVCDFGFTILVKDKRKAQQTRGSPFYMAPELLRGEGASRKTDVYAFGIILHFLITGELVPFAAPQVKEKKQRRLRELGKK
jgi:serine/threonine protein kinase